jgi:hypothetical protein
MTSTDGEVDVLFLTGLLVVTAVVDLRIGCKRNLIFAKKQFIIMRVSYGV